MEKFINGLVKLFMPPRRFANEDNDGAAVVEVAIEDELVAVETVLPDEDEFFDTAVAAAAAAAASKNIFMDGKLASIDGLNPKLEKLEEFAKFDEPGLLEFSAFT